MGNESSNGRTFDISVRSDIREAIALTVATVRALHATGVIKDMPAFADALEAAGEMVWWRGADGEIIKAQSPRRMSEKLRAPPVPPAE